MAIFELKNGSLVNILTLEALLSIDGKYYLICQSGNKYELDKEEFDFIKKSLQEKVPTINE